MNILIIDCRDSFTFNLQHYLEELAEEVTVVPYDSVDITIPERFDRIVLSPGPGHVSEYPILHQIVDLYKDKKAFLGICLGHQLIGAHFDSIPQNLEVITHGVSRITTLTDNYDAIFQGVPKSFQSARYHSWGIMENSLAPTLRSTARDGGVNMAFSHQNYNIRGLQFHPESILTPEGKLMLRNWVTLC